MKADICTCYFPFSYEYIGHSRDVLLNQMPTYGCDPNAPRAFTNKTPDAQPKGMIVRD